MKSEGRNKREEEKKGENQGDGWLVGWVGGLMDGWINGIVLEVIYLWLILNNGTKTTAYILLV